jgi:hypothetical protein
METFNESLINESLELDIDSYFEKFYSIFYPKVDKKFMKFLLKEDNSKNNNFYIDAEILKNFELITTDKSSEILKLIKNAKLRKYIDYTETQKKITNGSTSGLFYHDLEYKFTLKAFKILFISNNKNTDLQNIKEWIVYEECYKYYVKYIKLYLLNFNKVHLVNSNILDSNKELRYKIIELNNDIIELKDNIEILNDKADSLKVEFKDSMNTNIINIKKNIKSIIDFNHKNKNIKYNNYVLFFYNIIIIYVLKALINYIL